MEPKNSAAVGTLFRYTSIITPIRKVAEEAGSARKRRRNRNSHVYDADQDFSVPGGS